MSSRPASGGAHRTSPRGALVLGTAGHIDHGKTALVRALTGVDCDRLPEEKRRGITIELGFAPLDLGEDVGRLSVVDVPGHERFVRTMVAGAAGIDFVLLVVAADEGVMPQTREHAAICRLLGVEHGVVALSKCDLADAEMRALARDDVRELLAPTALAGAPVVACSATTGEGLDALRAALAGCAREARARTPRTGPPRLAIDRAFAAKGFGAVATGTLVGSALEAGTQVEIHPRGLRARVRGLQTHGRDLARAEPGARTAVNLQGVDASALARGDVVSLPGALAPTRALDVRIDWLGPAPARGDAASVELLLGTAERRARIAPIGAPALAPGYAGFARIHVEGDPVVALPGDRFVVRGFARTREHGATLGGGRVVDVAPHLLRRSDPALARELAELDAGDAARALRTRASRAGARGLALAEFARESGLAAEEVEASVRALVAEGAIAPAVEGVVVDAAALEALARALAREVDAHHRREPLRPGLALGTLRSRAPGGASEAAVDAALRALVERGELVVEADLARTPSHAPTLDAATRALVERMRADAAGAGLEASAPREWAATLGVPIERFRDLAAHLEREGALVRAPGDLWFARAAVDALVARVRAHLGAHGEVDTAAYKRLTGTTRRTTVPLMELLDALGVTRRDGDRRVAR
ncbi:MAG: selenocysteine-specific translation elongation factor [Myxococcota bacterium]